MDTNAIRESGAGELAREDELIVKRLKRVFGIAYFIQGTNGLVNLPIMNFIKNVLGLGDAGGQLFSSLMTIGWIIKPLWGFISDQFPIFGYKRKSWFVLMALVSFVSWMLSGLFTVLGLTDAWIYFLLFNIALTGYAFVDVVGDGLMVENGQRLKKVGSFVTFQWTMLAISSAIVGIISGWFSDKINEGVLEYWVVFILVGFFPVITAIVGYYNIPEEKIQKVKTVHKPRVPIHVLISGMCKWFVKIQHPGRVLLVLSYGFALPVAFVFGISSIWYVIFFLYLVHRFGRSFLECMRENKTLTLLILFIIFWNFSPSLGYIQWSYLTDVRGFSQTSFGILTAVGGIVFLLSIMFYKWMVNKFPNTKWYQYLYVMVAIGALSFPLSFFLYLNPDHPWWSYVLIFALPDSWFAWIPVISGWTRYEWFMLISSSLLAFATIFSFLIPLTIAGEGVKLSSAGMSYALLMSVTNATGMLGGTAGAGLYKYLAQEKGVQGFTYFIEKFQGTWMDVSGITDERTLIIQLFIWIGLLFTLLAVPFVYVLKREFFENSISVNLSS